MKKSVFPIGIQSLPGNALIALKLGKGNFDFGYIVIYLFYGS
ncbi:hypothetical protein [Heyndrickxia oleronia]|nr:hypothetical protein [Heyndrickxia oleronia]